MLTIRTLRPSSIRWAATITTLLLLATLATPALAHDGTAHEATSPEGSQRGQALGRSAPGLGAELARVRVATARYHRVEVALADGYHPMGPCVEDPNGGGAMGIHFVNGGRFGQLDPTKPQALLYLPHSDGRLRLVGVEYLSPFDLEDPDARPGELFGRTFDDTTPLGERTGLHVWLWQANPAGMFAAYNPNLSCPAA
ncbi:MAG: hypothetical protein EA340_08645 [Nitriliruptor sp.]|nr:MAG: hypothetical protein EA340_08645 [Nitriliruptor sp.]